MSKIGRKPIDISGVKIEVKNQEIHFKGSKNSGVFVLPEELGIELSGEKSLKIVGKQKSREVNRVWGLQRALLANKIKGATTEFVKELEIIGLGFKATKAGSNLVFSLGYSHKIDFELPKEVTIDIDKTGQKLTLKSFDKELLGKVCSQIKSLRLPEPYKGTGIKLKEETLRRKAGKTKAAAAG
ncbi:MAG: 50S ribosomal protein L6 [bacterium]|nr:50S ribosomal protein L6 [bacterium]